MNREEYEKRLDQLKGNARDIVENLQNLLDDPVDVYRDADEGYGSRLAERLEAFCFDLENLSAEFNVLEWRFEESEEDDEDLEDEFEESEDDEE